MQQDSTTNTPRDRVEAELMKRFAGHMHPLDERWITEINAHKDGSYGFGYLGLALYTNGYNIHSKSSRYPGGLIYQDDHAIFGVGVFFRPGKPGVPCVHIVAPKGENWQESVNRFTRQLSETMPEVEIFVRQLPFDQYKSLKPQTNLDRILQQKRHVNWTAIEANPWVKSSDGKSWATQEDETFCHGRVDMDAVISTPQQGMFHTIPWLPSANERNMKRRNYNGFQNFLTREKLEYTLEPYTPAMESDVRRLIQSHFDHLRDNGKAIGSTAADYEAILACAPEKCGQAGVHMYVGCVQNARGDKVPVSFFGLEEIGKATVAGYATITNYSQQPLAHMAQDFTGFNNIATYAMGKVMHEMKSKGMRWFHLGGSETRDLDTGKKRLGATETPTYWAIHNRPVAYERA